MALSLRASLANMSCMTRARGSIATLLAALVLGAAMPAVAQSEPPRPSSAPVPEVSEVAVEPAWAHGIAMHGSLKYEPGFRHFDYADPAAPKGGDIRLAASGGFDSFNPYITRGESAPGIGLIHDTLMVSSGDEAFSKYGLIAEAVRTPEDRSWVEFRLDARARFHDGAPITPEDVIWTFETLKSKGAPFYRFYYGSVESARKTGARTVRFDFAPGENRELPLIMGQLPVLPKHWWEGRDFESPDLEIPLGSGAYRLKEFEPGRYVVYERVRDYWAADKGPNKGRYNFDALRYDLFRDINVQVEALKAGEFDLRSENSAKNWAEAYNIPALDEGLLVKESFRTGNPKPMQGFIMNMRRWPFDNRQVRRALAAGFDFEWSNRVLYYGQYERARSYFNASELEATGLPEGRELEILEPFRDRLAPEVFAREYNPPATDGSGTPRANLLEALDILRGEGFEVNPETLKLEEAATGRPVAFELLLVSPSMQRVAIPFARNLARLGIDVELRLVDSSQYLQRINARDFDMFVAGWGQSLSPGNEQRDFWGSEAAERQGSRNYGGLKDPVVDALIETLIAAPDRQELVFRTRALDRVLQWQYLVVPQIYAPYTRVVYWDRFGHPETAPLSGLDLFAWWVDPDKAARTDRRRAAPGGS